MRLASRALRDVQLKRPVYHPWAVLLHPYSRPRANGIARITLRAVRGIRFFSISPPRGFLAEYDLIYPELSHSSKAPATTSDAPSPTISVSLVQGKKAFQKWSALLSDPARLAVESDFFRQGPAKEWRSRLLVDKFEHRGDLALWSCLLDYQVRINGPSGAAHVWKALWGRKMLYDVDGPLAAMFWRVMLEGALMCGDPSVLESIWVYSEWMYEVHRVKWPQLYTTVIRHMLRTHQHQPALQWQLRLAPNFYPGPDEFTAIIKEFALDKELYSLDTLPSLYKTNPERNMYSTLLPYLFNRGQSKLAREWRRVFIRHGEVPVISVSLRPFLRFMKGFHPNDKLVREESSALASTTEPTEDGRPELSREFVNRVHGRTFGITVKNYNDRLGAKWFASSWVSLDLAISTISALGIEEIGPLSLQSIALRAGSSGGLLNRVAQLREYGISVIDSNYFQTILYLARRNDDELLNDLVRSDIHPDVLDDLNLQTQLIDSAVDASDWRTLRLLLVARFVTFERSARPAANSVLRIRFQQKNQDGVLQILEFMKARNIPLNFEEADYIYEMLIKDYNLGGRSLTSQSASFYLSVFRRLKTMDIPVPLTHWRLILLSMARRGRLEDLERLSIELADMFLSEPSFRPGFVPVHVWDLPEAIKGPLGRVENLLGGYIPQDIPTSHIGHPLRTLFNTKVITAIVENAFIHHPGQGFRATHDSQPGRVHSQSTRITKTLRLLRVLNERGMWLRYRKIRFAVTNCLVSIYGPAAPADTPQRLMRAANNLSLKEMKALIDEAWGGELLPPLADLIKIVRKRPPDATTDSRELLEPIVEDEDDDGRDPPR